MADETSPQAKALDPEALAGVRHNVELVRQMLKDQYGEDSPPSRAGVSLLDGFIERNRLSIEPEKGSMISGMIGCYVGAALIEAWGGDWIVDDYGLGIQLAPRFVAFPISKAEKQWREGAEDSILSFFDVTIAMLKDGRG